MLRWILLLLLFLAAGLLLLWRLRRKGGGSAAERADRPGLSPIQELQGVPPRIGPSRHEDRGEEATPDVERSVEERPREADSRGDVRRSSRWAGQ